ncbi:MAG: peroxiredoxin [Bauldia sp.]
MIKVGDRIPEAVFKVKDESGTKDVLAADYFANRRVVVFGLPGAFTPTCSRNHLPGYIQNADRLHAKGVDRVAVVSVNDHHVMQAWAKASGGEGTIDYLADGSAKFVTALGLAEDRSNDGMGMRSKRWAMIVEDGVVRAVNVEDASGKVTSSSAETILALL